MDLKEARFWIDLIVEAEGGDLNYSKPLSAERKLAKLIIQNKIDEEFDISECSYDHYNRSRVIRAEIFLEKLTEARKIIFGDDIG